MQDLAQYCYDLDMYERERKGSAVTEYIDKLFG